MNTAGEKPGIDLGLDESERRALHAIARSAIQAALEGAAPPPARPDSPRLLEPRGAFVTLHYRDRLRGCIGMISAAAPLYHAVHDMALSAAFRDPRFPPLQSGELEGLSIEISVLTPFEELTSVENIVIGRHGLMITRGSNSGLLLPQVPVEQGWDRDTFLDQTCIKAGLPPGSWREADTRILFFSADVF